MKRKGRVFRKALSAMLMVALLTSDLPVNALENTDLSINENAEITEVSKTMEEAEIPEEPKAIEEGETSTGPEATEEAEIPKGPEETENPEVPKNPEETENPETSGNPEETENPEAPENPEVTENPEKPGDLEVTKESETAGVTEETKDSDAEVTETLEDDCSGLLSFDELMALPDDEVGATMWWDEIMPMSMAEGSSWSFDAYYVNQPDSNYVEKTSDFDLKYQMEFHASQIFEPGDVKVRIPAVLLTDRDGNKILPTEIAVPKGDEENPVESGKAPFNYYMDGDDIVFFNYKKIPSGRNVVWQVLYKNLKLMEIVDLTSWSLQPEIEVHVRDYAEDGTPSEDYKTETQMSEPLEGLVDSSITLTSMSKTPYTAAGRSYTPGLYTSSQVESFLSGPLPDKYKGKNFSKYKYVVWDVKVTGNATQPWSLEIKEDPFIGNESGEVVGYKENISGSYFTSIDTDLPETPSVPGYQVVKKDCRDESFGCRFYVVTAYPVDKCTPGTTLGNRMSVRLVPCDNDEKDVPQTKEASGGWSYADYRWSYAPGKYTSIHKEGGGTYPAWLVLYKAASDKGRDYGSFPFTVSSGFQGYHHTHGTKQEEPGFGQYIDGKSYKLTTVDDFLYVIPSVNVGTGADQISTKGKMMTGEDYYFSSVTVRQTDIGYDVWEDQTAPPETPDGVDQNVYIYAMLAEPGPGDAADAQGWVLVKTIPWDDTGVMTCTLDEDVINKKPWRIKVEHSAVNYRTSCQIDVNVCIRAGSPLMRQILAEEDVETVQFENLSGIICSSQQNGTFEKYFKSEEYNYQEPGLEDTTRELYVNEDKTSTEKGILPQRSNAEAVATGLKEHAASYKSSKSVNDTSNGRVHVNYSLTAYDGYEVYDQESVNALKSMDVESPGRNAVVFYDLLPYGVHFDPSGEIIAGRITNLSTPAYQTQPGAWDLGQVTVTVDSQKDIIPNYQGTGRTMIIFHIRYSGADPAVCSNSMWAEGWGVSFKAYYDWKDMGLVSAESNICAFLPDRDGGEPLTRLHGKAGEEVFCDDGSSYPVGLEAVYENFGADFNEDEVWDVPYVLYAKNTTRDDFVVAGSSEIRKLVRADSDRFGVYETSAVVEPGGYYTYDITVSNASDNDLKNIVVYDHLEQANRDRADVNDQFKPFEKNPWHGTFESVITTGLTELGINPVIYYSAADDAPFSKNEEDPEEVLTEKNGWYRADKFLESHEPEAVKSVAINLSKNKEGRDFSLGNMESATFQIRMKAPDTVPETVYAYNNPAYHAQVVAKDGPVTHSTEQGNSVRVKLGEKKTLEVVKKFDENAEIPEAVKDTEFEFRLTVLQMGENSTEKEVPLAYREYRLCRQKEDGEEWIQQTGRIYATDGNGYLTLHAGEKAVFLDLADADKVKVEEVENPFWDVEYTEDSADDKRTVTAVNAYRPVLYVTKKLMGTPPDQDLKDTPFTFQVEVSEDGENWTPLSDVEYWYVDSVRTDGGAPSKVTESGNSGVGSTDTKGQFTMKAGEIIALFPGPIGTYYRVTEVQDSADDGDWQVEYKNEAGVIPLRGAAAEVTNVYRWKDLYMMKALTHQEPAECNQEFTFRVTHVITEADGTETEEPVTGNEWVLLDADNRESTADGEHGTLGPDGSFSCACAGKTVKIKKLEEGQTYIVQELTVDADGNPLYELYRPVNDVIRVTMPHYASVTAPDPSKLAADAGYYDDITITNDYLKRPLTVTKQVVYDPNRTDLASAAESAEFTMTVYVGKDASGGWIPLANAPYILTGNGISEGDTTEHRTDAAGKLKIKDGQTATFKEVGMLGTPCRVVETPDAVFPQISPAVEDRGDLTGESGAYEGALSDNPVTFINGQEGLLLISKEYEAAKGDSKAEEYIQLMQLTDTADENYGTGASLREEAAVEMKLQVKDASGKISIWPGADTTVTVIDQLTNISTEKIWAQGSSFSVKPWEIVMILPDELNGVVSYTLSESAKDQHRVFEYDAQTRTWMETSQKTPADDQAISGKLEEMPAATIVNQAESYKPEGSLVEKRMAVGSTEVSTGAQLVWRLERYDGAAGIWKPAKGVEYLTFDSAGATCDGVMTTGDDGRIVLEKTDNGFPKVQFLKEKVYLNVYQEGDARNDMLRLREDMEESEESWGLLAGYGSEESGYTFDINSDAMDGEGNPAASVFVNSNRMIPVEIEKKMDTPSDVTFQMLLKQVLSSSAAEGQIPLAGQILESAAAVGMEYILYDTKTNERVGSGVTDKEGAISLKAGQYARLYLPDGTLWTVSEKSSPGYRLKNLSGTGEVSRLSDNLMLIGAKGEKVSLLDVQLTGRIISGSDPTIEDIKKLLDVTVYYSDNSKEHPTDYEVTVTGDDPVTVTVTCGDMEQTVTIPTVDPIDLTAVMVDKGVIDAVTGKPVTLNEGVVSVPGYIVWKGKEYAVTGIEEGTNTTGCFEGKPVIEVTLPDTLKEIGERAFYGCKDLRKVDIPDSVTRIGKNAFYKCESLRDVKLPSSLTTLEGYAFGHCALESVEIPEGVTELPRAVFSTCKSLKSVVFLGDKVKTIGINAFWECAFETIDLPDSVTTIKDAAFMGCKNLREIRLPEKLTTIEGRVFYNCTNLSGDPFVIPENVTSIGTEQWKNLFTDTNIKSIQVMKPYNESDKDAPLWVYRPWGLENGTVYDINNNIVPLPIP